ncbi:MULTISPECIES: AarF/ABC1/UbiB kinase family protein [unclassified Roseivivax]|uniref:ABC1 kinase family protein n=1 Tax=unclassified Roseivivax TaxID=2639302 RepID=UPI001267E094|nr:MULTISPECIES: AarF/ABC1/UbiB kinase family protein [unclassified Roseivivax]
MSSDDRTFPVPSSRLSRVGRMGRFASGVLGRAAQDSLRAFARGDRPGLQQLMMTPANAAKLAEELSRMRGAAMKMGQLLSMEAGEVLPAELADVLSRLRSEAHYMPPEQLKTVLSDNWGPDFLKQFKKFDVRPIAAASIGQVHRAVTKDGRELAIKVQYPGIRASIDSDIRNLGALLKMSGMLPKGLDLSPLLEEARLQLHEEADYELEARSLTEFGAHLAEDADFVVPALAEDLTTRDILAMEYIDSRPIESLTEADAKTRNSVAEKLIALTLRELFDLTAMQTDPNFANFRYQPETGRIVLLDFGAVRRFEEGRVAAFRDLMRAALSGDRTFLHQAAITVGYLRDDTADHHREQILDMMEIAAAPLQGYGPFDFARAGLATRFAEAGQRFAEDREFTVIPPVDALFLQRKVGGLYLLCARLGAQIPVRPLLEKHAPSSIYGG